ncbi:MAG: SPFH/Band 7/PHB domain protein [Candidatus Riflebacteria bacterium]|nr:SPFH/Band 7/PHB domain protein [Candidatus Riflebacteria bacterium]
MASFFGMAFFTFFACLFGMEIFLFFLRLLGLYTTVEEGFCKVYILFGNVAGILTEPGFYFLPTKIGLGSLLINWLGACHTIDLRLDQTYLRSQPVNSEEGAPMGIGIWYEMFIHDPIAYIFKNADPQGSLAANVSSSTIRCLSNMPLTDMMGSRHGMSQTVRKEVSPLSQEWGYKLGSVYIRKVHFRDVRMIKQIEEKVVNRLRQVTSAINQDGANKVSLITSSAERKAAIDFAKAAAIRPSIVGNALAKISQDPEIASAVFDILELQKLLENPGDITLLPKGRQGLIPFLVEGFSPKHATKDSLSSPS